MSYLLPSLPPEIVGRRNDRPWRRRPHRAHWRHFGKRPVRDFSIPEQPKSKFSDDLMLFATTFAAGFLFVSIFIG